MRRQIDFIVCAQSIFVVSAGATLCLDLGSDHPTVEYCLTLNRGIPSREKYKQQPLWKPRWSDQSLVATSRTQLNHALSDCLPTNLDELEDIVRHACLQCSEKERAEYVCSPKESWRQHEFQDLLRKRRMATCKHERACLSKAIRKILRKHLREKWNKCIEHVLSEFACLKRLYDLGRGPIHRIAPVHQTPEPSEFVEYFNDIFRLEVSLDTPVLHMLDNVVAARGFQEFRHSNCMNWSLF